MCGDDNVCRVTKKCKYGCPLGGGGLWICNYILDTGESRTSKPEGKIINGKCDLFIEGKRSKKKLTQIW